MITESSLEWLDIEITKVTNIFFKDRGKKMTIFSAVALVHKSDFLEG